MKTLIFDLETAPSLAHVWRYWQENVSAKQIKEHPFIMSFAAKWLGEKEVFYEEQRTSDDRLLVEKLVYYLDQADLVVAHNGAKFDLPKIKGRALVHGIKPFSPVRIIDTLKVARKNFGFGSNSLEYLSTILDCQVKKQSHKKFPGFELWKECMKGNEEAWAEMKEYNIDDVLALEEIYIKMRPWIDNHPNVVIDGEIDQAVCTSCGSVDIQWRGYAYTNTAKYHRFQCNSCGSWGRSRYTLLKKNENILKAI